MEIITQLLSFILHIDVHLGELISAYGPWCYALLFVIVFIETGVVVMPFLPGDSLLFAAGTFAAQGSFHVTWLALLLWLAAVLGDMANYWIGHFFGQKLIDNPRIPIQQKHIDRTQAFYAKHGNKTIILARFIPIVRTFAPFLAGIGKMSYRHFLAYNVVGGFIWAAGFVFLGYFFGNIPLVRDNFSTAILLIIGLSVLPVLLEYLKHIGVRS
jgi:membrane-associated protein